MGVFIAISFMLLQNAESVDSIHSHSLIPVDIVYPMKLSNRAGINTVSNTGIKCNRPGDQLIIVLISNVCDKVDELNLKKVSHSINFNK